LNVLRDVARNKLLVEVAEKNITESINVTGVGDRWG
jgi:hypothetical protein